MLSPTNRAEVAKEVTGHDINSEDGIFICLPNGDIAEWGPRFDYDDEGARSQALALVEWLADRIADPEMGQAMMAKYCGFLMQGIVDKDIEALELMVHELMENP